MKKLVLALAVASLLLSCKKETTATFKAEGFWRGNLNVFSLVVINTANGKSRMYIGSTYSDTSMASYKFEGVFEVKNNLFRATYYDGDSAVAALYSDQTATSKIWGTGYVQQSGLEFELTKEKD